MLVISRYCKKLPRFGALKQQKLIGVLKAKECGPCHSSLVLHGHIAFSYYIFNFLLPPS